MGKALYLCNKIADRINGGTGLVWVGVGAMSLEAQG